MASLRYFLQELAMGVMSVATFLLVLAILGLCVLVGMGFWLGIAYLVLLI